MMVSIDIKSDDFIPKLENLNSESEEGSCPSDCESLSTDQSENEQPRTHLGLIRIGNGEPIYETVKNKLVSCLGSCGVSAMVESIHRIDFTDKANRARLVSFCIYSKAVGIKCGGDTNGKYAWFGASKNEIDTIVAHGFSFPTSNPTHGHGVYLSPADHPIESVQSAAPDEDGLTHMLLCRVILGKTEAISPCSEQYNPSSEEFDSGVDNIESPQKYIIWTSRMNSHILPEFVVSFRAASFCRDSQRTTQHPKQPKSDWMPFPALINVLHKFLPSDAIELIKKHHSDFKNQKLTRDEMIRRVRHIAGDKLLMVIIKFYRKKIKPQSMLSGTSSFQQPKKEESSFFRRNGLV